MHSDPVNPVARGAVPDPRLCALVVVLLTGVTAASETALFDETGGSEDATPLAEAALAEVAALLGWGGGSDVQLLDVAAWLEVAPLLV